MSRELPPRLAEWLLKLILRTPDREYILGDLAETYRAKRRRGRGAGAWYWGQLLRAVPAIISRAAERRNRASRSSAGGAGGTWTGMRGLAMDLRSVLRGLARARGYTGAAVGTLALGTGANVAVFTLLNGVLLQPLPFEDPDRLISLWFSAPGVAAEPFPASSGMYFTYRAEARAFTGIGAWWPHEVSVVGGEGAERIGAIGVTADLLPILGVEPLVGRTFAAEDDAPGAPGTVLLSHAYWRSHFGGDRGVLGRSVEVEGNFYEIIGVLPPRVTLPGTDAAIYLPLRWSEAEGNFGGFRYHAVARLRRDATLEDASRDLERMIPIAAERYFNGITVPMLEEMGFAPVPRPLREEYVGDVGRVLWVLFGTVGIVLLISCANVANLSLVRAEVRRREVAIRRAMGASPWQVTRHAILEFLSLGALGGVVALGLAAAGVELVLATAPAGLPRANEIALGPASLAFTMATSLFAALLFGLFPLVRIIRMDPGAALKRGGPATEVGPARHRTRDALVVAQVAFALVLLTGSGLMIRTFQALRQIEPGFSQPQEVLTFQLTIPESNGASELEVAATFEDIARRLEAIPGIVSVAGATSLPMDGSPVVQDPLLIEDVPWLGDDVPPLRRFKWVTGDYFATLQNPLVGGRAIDWRDIRDRAPVAVVTQNFAEGQWGDARAALGKRVALVGSVEASDNAWHTVVGVVQDVRDDGVDEPPPPIVFWPMVMHRSPEDLFVPRSMVFAVRISERATVEALPEVREAVATVDPTLPLGRVRTLEEVLRRSMVRTSFMMVMLVIASGVALSLGLVGIYGVVSYATRLRTREIGLRMALGSDARAVRRMVLGHGARLALYGIGVGLVAALGMTQAMSSLLHSVEPHDPVTLSAVVALLVTMALLATYLPASKASRTDPMEALRAD